jgi:hypothetical protein
MSGKGVALPKALMTSGYTEEIAVDRAGFSDPQSVARKPYRQAELKQTIREVLGL